MYKLFLKNQLDIIYFAPLGKKKNPGLISRKKIA